MNSRSLLFISIVSSVLIYNISDASWFWTPRWIKSMRADMSVLEKEFNGEFGVYVLDLEENEKLTHNADQFWYLSSTIKIPVAIALLQLVDQKKMELTEKVTIKKADYRDGAGPVNWLEPGSKVSYKYLLKQMLIYSDNAATDLIIKKVGLKQVNELVQKYSTGDKFGPITTLLEVRKKAYGHMHPEAANLSTGAFLRIKKKRGAKARTKQLVKELKIKPTELKEPDLDTAFERYYAERWNSATLESYAELLKNVLKGKLLSPQSARFLFKTMSGIQTGKKRIRKGLNKDFYFAHKTGTQRKQACDIGFTGHNKSKKPKALILVCTRRWKKLSDAEKLMSKVAKALSKTDLLKEE